MIGRAGAIRRLPPHDLTPTGSAERPVTRRDLLLGADYCSVLTTARRVLLLGDVDLVQLHQAVHLAQLRERHDAVVGLFKFEPH